jgi:hypothetical protein
VSAVLRAAAWLLGVVALLGSACGDEDAHAATRSLALVVAERSVAFAAPFAAEVVLVAATGDRFDEVEPDSLAPMHAEFVERTQQAVQGGTRSVWRFRLRALELGRQQVAVPEMAVVAADGGRHTLAAEPQTIEVISALVETDEGIEMPQMMPIGGRHGRAFWWWLLLPVVALVAGVAWFRRRRPHEEPVRPRGSSAPQPVVDHRQVARQELARLRGQVADAGGSDAGFHEVLVAAVRAFAVGQHGIDAAHCTTAELLSRLPDPDLKRCLERCDLVRFAARPADAEGRGIVVEAAVAFVERGDCK